MRLATICLLLFSINSFASIAGKVIFSKGEVYQLIDKKKVSLKKGSSLKNNHHIVTGKNALAVLSLQDGSKIKMNEKSKLQIKLDKVTKVALYKGSSFFKVIRSKITKKNKFKVVTKTASLGVRGTEFFVSYGKGKKQDLWMCVNEGLVAIKANKAKSEKLVKEGEGVHVSDNKTVSNPAPLPWTKKLNWNTSIESGSLENTVNIEDAYTDLLDQDYD